jgi:hypothetical protein
MQVRGSIGNVMEMVRGTGGVDVEVEASTTSLRGPQGIVTGRKGILSYCGDLIDPSKR